MTEFKEGEGLGRAIRKVLQGADVQCAVAFWGSDACAELFPNGIGDAQIICDLTMGGSNPEELRKLGAPTNQHLKHIRGLHSKIYVSGRGLVVCSANASNNGIGFLGEEAALVEAGTFEKPGNVAYEAARDWFKGIWNKAEPVGQPALDLATDAWERRQRGARTPATKRSYDARSLLDSMVARSTSLRGAGIVFTTGYADNGVRKRAAKAIIAADDRLPTPLVHRSDRSTLKEWELCDIFFDWKPEEINAWPGLFVCAHRGPRGGFSYSLYKRAHESGIEGVVLARPLQRADWPVRFECNLSEMARFDAQRANSIFSHIWREYKDEKGYLCETVERLEILLADSMAKA